MQSRSWTIASAVVLAAGCHALAGLDDFVDVPGDGTTTTTGTAGSTATGGGAGHGDGGTAGAGGPEGGGGAVGGGGIGGAGGSGGIGGAGGSGGGTPPPLVDAGLVVRYFLDEAASGTTPTQALDSAPSSQHLTMDYGSAPFHLGYTEAQGNRGLNWDGINRQGRPYGTVVTDDKIYTALEASTTATLEVVVDPQQFDVTKNSFFWNLRGSIAPRFAFGHDGVNSRLFFHWNGSNTAAGTWVSDLTTANGRSILHLVLDTSLGAASQRVQLYVGGISALGSGSPAWPNLNEDFVLPPSSDLALGNWADGSAGSFSGTLHYVALYEVAFTPQQIAQNTAALAASDDTP